MIGGVTHRMIPHLSGVPHYHVNRPLIVVYCLLHLLKNKSFHASFIHKNFSGQFLSTYFPFWEILIFNLFAIWHKRGSLSLYYGDGYKITISKGKCITK